MSAHPRLNPNPLKARHQTKEKGLYKSLAKLLLFSVKEFSAVNSRVPHTSTFARQLTETLGNPRIGSAYVPILQKPDPTEKQLGF